MVLINQKFAVEIAEKKNSTLPLTEFIAEILTETETWKRGWAKNFLTEKLSSRRYPWIVSVTDIPGIQAMTLIFSDLSGKPNLI